MDNLQKAASLRAFGKPKPPKKTTGRGQKRVKQTGAPSPVEKYMESKRNYAKGRTGYGSVPSGD